MGNRSSTQFPPPPPQWVHSGGPRGPYPGEGKRPIGPGAFAEPYVPHPNIRRSVISLNADSGYLTSPSTNSDRMRMRGSRMSLNHVEFDHLTHPPPPPHPHPHILIPPDAKTLKKIEKMEKKQQKLWKKLGARMPPMPPPMHRLPPPPPLYSRALSFDDLNRIHEAEVESRQFRREWFTPGEIRVPISRRDAHSRIEKAHYPHNNTRTRDTAGSLASSSPMTSSEGQSSDPWMNSSISSSREAKNRMSPPIYTSTPHSSSPKLKNVAKTIEVKVERTEKVEQRTQTAPDAGRSSGGNATYAQPIIRGQPVYGSRSSSVATSHLRCDQSEIDFSWVTEEEDKLKREQRIKKVAENDHRLPECYFGMDPPVVEEKEEKENNKLRRFSVLDKAAALEHEVRRREAMHLSRSSTHLTEPCPDYSPLQLNSRDSGPSERRIYRIQRQTEGVRDDKRQQRSSMAF